MRNQDVRSINMTYCVTVVEQRVHIVHIEVMYVEGTAVVMGFEDPMLQTDDTPIKRCLQTKWPCIELLWTTERSPSLN
ncbi:Protein FAM188A [Microtus ochrogaster]|uniref:Protein FAM188A n=1 Tax=Microtus ochrogaster TaxID=79684 RepID=A0A8J6KJJ0_MICOH|nr:Protein FAM188A [Microtus ochrogaster]